MTTEPIDRILRELDRIGIQRYIFISGCEIVGGREMMKPDVLVFSYYDPSVTDVALRKLLPIANWRRVQFGRKPTEDELIAALAGVPIAIVSDEPFSRRVIESLPDLRLLCCDGVGVDHIDLPAATRAGVIVVNAPVVHEANGDFVMGMIVALVRKMFIADRGVREGRWNERSRYVSRDVFGSTLGLLGFGRVARAVARRATAFGMNVIAYSPHADVQVAGELGVTIVTLPELLAQSDIFSIHVTLNDNTRGMIGVSEFARMKDGAYLINSSRGPVVDEAAMIAALRSGKLAGAALDVFTDEPPALDNPLLRMENVIVSPHVGSDTSGTFLRVFECAVRDIQLYLEGKTPLNVVNKAVLQTKGKNAI